MNILTIGNGGREHAMMLAFEQGNKDIQQYAIRANAGMERVESLQENLRVRANSKAAIVRTALEHEIDLVVVGPEAPLFNGLADTLRAEGTPVLGLGRQAAKLESSKAFGVDFADSVGILAPKSNVATTPTEARKYLKAHNVDDIVIKADGPAAGKGAILPKTDQEAEEVVGGMLRGELFGESGRRIVFQERLTGPEVSMFALFDGEKAVVLPLAQDHKRLKDNDEGPNTGGMGAYASVPESIANEQQVGKMHDALERTIEGLQSLEIASPGILYFGFMLADQYSGDPVLIEYNARLGDPEAQVVLPLLNEAGVNVAELFYETATGNLQGEDQVTVVKQAGRSALTTCLATREYPGEERFNYPVYNSFRTSSSVIIHHGATEYRDEKGHQVFATGGRAVYVTGLGDSVAQAANNSLNAIGDDGVYFRGMKYRKDIGHQVITRV